MDGSTALELLARFNQDESAVRNGIIRTYRKIVGEAAEELLQQGYTPPQDVYLSSSCTEEFAGPGCSKLVAELKRRGVRPFLVCDEGGGIITDPIAGIHGNFAMLGVFEKGKGDVRFTARSGGGHASAPPANTPIARLAAFVTDVESKSPLNLAKGIPLPGKD